MKVMRMKPMRIKNENATSRELFNPEDPSDSMEDNPKTIDIRTVVEMFGSIKEEIQLLKKEGQKVKDVNKKQNETSKQVREIKKELKQEKLKNTVLHGVMIGMAQNMTVLEQRIQRLEEKNLEKAIVITGLKVRKRKKDCINDIYNFMENDLGIEVQIADAYPTGSMRSKSIAVVFETLEDKRKVFQKMNVIKQLLNEEEQPYYVNDLLTQEMNEQKRRHRQIAKITTNEDENTKIRMDRHNIYINDECYVKKVEVPTYQTILDMDAQQLNEILSIPVVKGGKIQQDGSTFIGYTIAVNSHEQVQRAYHKIKLVHADARHVICGYDVPGIQKEYCQDFCDDKEMGAGRQLLNILLRNDITHRAVFVVRYFGGKRMGPARYECIVEAAKTAILQDPYNSILKKEQHILPSDPQQNAVDTKESAVYTRPKIPQKFQAPLKQRRYVENKYPRRTHGRPPYNRGQPSIRRINRTRDQRQYDPYAMDDLDYDFERPNFQFSAPTQINSLNPDEWPKLPAAKENWS